MLSEPEAAVAQLLKELADLRADNARLQAQLAQASTELQNLTALNAAQDQFVSQVSHDLRAPLANIKLYTDLLKKGQPDKREEYYQVLLQQIARLQKMLDDLLDISRLDMGKTEFHWSQVDVNTLLAELSQEWQPAIAAHGLQFQLELAATLPLTSADPTLLKQAITHILKNAHDYAAPEGRIVCRTTIRQIADQTWIAIATENSGPGLAEDELEHIGERFYRGRAARQYKVEGTGLGLAICREIVTRHTGRVTIDSEPGHSVTFTIWLKPTS